MRILPILLIAVLSAALVYAQKNLNEEPPQPQQDDETILNTASNARDQVDNFTEVLAVGSLMEKMQKHEVDFEKAEKLLNDIELDIKNEKHWEKTVWTIPNSEMFPGETIESHLGTFLMMQGTGRTMRQRFPDCTRKKECAPISDTDEAFYVVKAPLDVKAHIMMEGLRHGISHWSAIQDFEGKPPDDVLVTSWTTVWFDARNVYCRRSPGAKYFDLSNEEQICK
jgi:hypothetical protein